MTNIITTNDLLQPGYSYELVEPIGENFDDNFNPELTPQEMFEIGVFGGNYFEGYINEFPNEWTINGKFSDQCDPKINFFNVNASMSREHWLQKGWINENDPRGWFQWYCRYYLGRRIPKEDKRQIGRRKAIKRHVSAIKKNCYKNDHNCRRKQRQAVLHWAYDSRQY